MDAHRSVAVSPRHSVALASELFHLIGTPPATDFVLRTLAKREANGLPLMTAELVIASADTRRIHPGAEKYPLHFRKTYFPGRLRGEPKDEYEHHLRASQLTSIPPPIGFETDVFRSCLIPGQPYARLTPFGGEPLESNIAKAERLALATSAGLWRLAEETLALLLTLHEGGLAHGDAELHNVIVCPAPLESVLIDFEGAQARSKFDDAGWKRRRELDLEPLLREAVYLQCALGRQHSRLGDLAWERSEQLFKSPDRFRRAIELRAEV